MTSYDELAFQIISLAGDGRSKITEAMKQARKNNFGKAEDALKEADKLLLKAHELQTQELLKKYADGTLTEPINVVITHAQDYVMTALSMRDMAEEIVHLYAKLNK